MSEGEFKECIKYNRSELRYQQTAGKCGGRGAVEWSTSRGQSTIAEQKRNNRMSYLTVNHHVTSCMRMLLLSTLASAFLVGLAKGQVGNTSNSTTLESINTANPNATPEAKAILRWMEELPSRKDARVLSGQHFGRDAASYRDFIESFHDETGRWISLAGADVGYTENDEKPFPGYDIDELTDVLIGYWNSGGLITLSYHAPHPWTGSHSWDKTPRDLRELITPGNAAHTAYMKDLDRVAEALTKLRNAGVVVIWRPFHECNGTWFWWGHREGRETGLDLIELWRHQYRYLTKEKKLNNLLWAYSPSSNAHEKVSVMFYYPGDDYVDIVGVDFYGDEIALDGYEELTQLDKPFGLTEFGPHRDSAGRMDYHAFIRTVREKYPRTTFFLPWHTGWSIIENKNGDAMMDDPWIIDRSEIDCRAVPSREKAPRLLFRSGFEPEVALEGYTNFHGVNQETGYDWDRFDEATRLLKMRFKYWGGQCPEDAYVDIVSDPDGQRGLLSWSSEFCVTS